MAYPYNLIMLHNRFLMEEATSILPPPTTTLPVPNSTNNILKVAVMMLITANFLFLVYYFICLCIRRQFPRPSEMHVIQDRTTDDCVELADIPVVVIQSSQPPASLSCYESDSCFICLGSFSNGDEVRVLPKCNHIFHKVCIDLWLSASASSSCPVCRVRVVEPVVPPAGPNSRLERSQMLYPVNFPTSLI